MSIVPSSATATQVNELAPCAVLVDESEETGSLQFDVPLEGLRSQVEAAGGRGGGLPELFEQLQARSDDGTGAVLSYSVAQPTLEQCFLKLVKAFDSQPAAAISRSASFRVRDQGGEDDEGEWISG